MLSINRFDHINRMIMLILKRSCLCFSLYDFYWTRDQGFGEIFAEKINQELVHVAAPFGLPHGVIL